MLQWVWDMGLRWVYVYVCHFHGRLGTSLRGKFFQVLFVRTPDVGSNSNLEFPWKHQAYKFCYAIGNAFGSLWHAIDSHAKGKPQFHERLYQRPFCFLKTQLISKIMIQNGGKTAPAKNYWHIKNTTIGWPKIEQTFLVWWPNDSPFSKSARHSNIISHAALLSFKVHLGRKHRFAPRKWRGSSKHFRSTRSNS